MNLLVLPDAAHVARYVSSLVQSTIRTCPTAAIALPTGKTPLPIYAALAPRLAARKVDASGVSWFALDEFLGKEVPPEATFRHFLLTRFIEPAGLSPERLFTLCSASDDPAAEAARYESAIRDAGGLALALLGLGGNGHIAFNEPGSPRDGRTGLRPLTESTRQANQYLFTSASAVPQLGLSMGIGTLLEARRIVMAATGSGKADIVARLAASEPDEALPASLLKRHLDCTVVLDEEAAAGL